MALRQQEVESPVARSKWDVCPGKEAQVRAVMLQTSFEGFWGKIGLGERVEPGPTYVVHYVAPHCVEALNGCFGQIP